MATTAPTFSIRPAVDSDIPAITAIYAHYVDTSVATFETAPAPPASEMASRFTAIQCKGQPYLVAVDDASEAVLGYAYAGTYKPRAAYDSTLEDSIYFAPESRGRGVGKALLVALLDACTDAGFRQMIAVIADPAGAGAASVGLHKKLGFRDVGTLESAGWKFERWIDVGLLQRPMGVGAEAAPTRK